MKVIGSEKREASQERLYYCFFWSFSGCHAACSMRFTRGHSCAKDARYSNAKLLRRSKQLLVDTLALSASFACIVSSSDRIWPTDEFLSEWCPASTSSWPEMFPAVQRAEPVVSLPGWRHLLPRLLICLDTAAAIMRTSFPFPTHIYWKSSGPRKEQSPQLRRCSKRTTTALLFCPVP